MANEGAAQKQNLRDGEARSNVSMKGDDFEWPRDANGVPMIKITAAAAELIPTIQYGNVTIGPVSVTRFVADPGDDEELLKLISKVATVCEHAVAEDRQTAVVLMRSRIERQGS